MSYLEWIKKAIKQLTGSDSPKLDAVVLLSYITGRSRAFLMAFSETVLTNIEQEQLEIALQRRIKGEPIAYITGFKEFWSLSIQVSKETLIPRSDTEKLVETALQYLPEEPCEILDLGTGTGAIALALAHERPDCLIFGVDKLKSVVALAKQNAERLSLQNTHFMQSDWFKNIKRKKFAMIVSNPPYIDPLDVHLSQGDVRYEPSSALISDEKGLHDIMHIIKEASSHLLQYGWLLIEHGFEQGEAVRQLLKNQGYQLIQTIEDYAGNDRVTFGRWYNS